MPSFIKVVVVTVYHHSNKTLRQSGDLSHSTCYAQIERVTLEAKRMIHKD